MSATGTKPDETPQVRRGVVLPRVHAVPRREQFSPEITIVLRTGSESAPQDGPGRRGLALLGGMAAVAVAVVAVAVAVMYLPFRSSPHATPADMPGTAAPPQAASPLGPTASPQSDNKTHRGHPTPRTPTPTPSAAPHRKAKAAAHHWGTLVVSATYELDPGQSVRTNRISLGLTNDGDLVLRDEHGRTAWSSGTHATGARAVFQNDGNLAVYQGTQTLWSSRTDGHAGATLVLADNGQVIITWSGTVLWKAGP